MDLLTLEQRQQLLTNGDTDNRDQDHYPVVKLFTPDAAATWLLTELDPDNPDIAFGLCDLGLGYPELGYVSMAELTQVRGRFGLPVERDIGFTAKHPISIYARAARIGGEFTENAHLLSIALEDALTPHSRRSQLHL